MTLIIDKSYERVKVKPGITAVEIRALREKLGLTQQQAAEIIGVTVTSWWRWEHGKARPSALAERALRKLDK